MKLARLSNIKRIPTRGFASSPYQYNTVFTQDDASVKSSFQAKYKSTFGFGTDKGKLVVWAESDPILNINLSWSDNYGVYASKSEILPNGLIVESSKLPATLGASYSWNGSYFTLNGNGPNPDSIEIINTSGDTWTLGLTKQNSNGNYNPINADLYLPGVVSSIKPLDTLYTHFGKEYETASVVADIGKLTPFTISPGTYNFKFDTVKSVWTSS
eukprot:CAMPEP_0196763460 /NCGR_PEP_ID=MMETSP1095-20130614/4111_1 /TAXON_ID=96789 ORGANISM="Chromulina nebulosa, Strain UTEXLB2642" /NCGR_SAMPLE_ID=MMETSP1095 /ASSEMBLY_ACC=CAM_ASM_000446 /LENGTH=213 /DNA_ID=CAMNT_0042116675 /DNA_START=40 /DNA_END=678 /DNA_ORIENTATION=-